MLPMRLLGLALSLLLTAPAPAAADGEGVVRDFVNALQAGDVVRAKNLVDPRFRSWPADGTEVLFHYESAYEPNLAFLLGQPFAMQNIVMTTPIRSEWYFLDGVRGAMLTVPLRFDRARGPFFLPTPLAFGRSMDFVAFMDFVKRPESGRFEALTLRFRPSVAPGLITPTSPPSGPTVRIPPPPGPAGASRAPAVMAPMQDFRGAVVGTPGPRDAGPVVLPSRETLTPDQLAALLPRLSAIDLLVTVMKRGRLASWKIEDVRFTNVVVVSDGLERPLR